MGEKGEKGGTSSHLKVSLKVCEHKHSVHVRVCTQFFSSLKIPSPVLCRSGRGVRDYGAVWAIPPTEKPRLVALADALGMQCARAKTNVSNEPHKWRPRTLSCQPYTHEATQQGAM